MRSFRVRDPFSDEWTSAYFDGEREDEMIQMLAATLLRLDYEVEGDDEEEEIRND